MTDIPDRLITGDLTTGRTTVLRAEVFHRVLAGERTVVLDEAWQFLPKADHPVWRLSRRGSGPTLQTVADLGDEASGLGFLRPADPLFTAGCTQPA